MDPPPYKALLSSPLLIKEVRAVSVIEIKQMILVLSLKANHTLFKQAVSSDNMNF